MIASVSPATQRGSFRFQNNPVLPISLNNHQATPIFIAPESKERVHKSKWDYVGLVGIGLSVFVAVLTVLSPLARKYPVAIANALTPLLKKLPKNRALKSNEIQANLLALLQDKKRLETILKKALMGTLFFQNVNKYETAYNSKQPSLMLHVLALNILTLFGLKTGKDIIFLLMQPFGIFYTLGKRNDIENNLHPEKRRDWDMARIKYFFVHHPNETKASHNQTLGKELKSFFHFISDDIRLTQTLSPWKTLIKDFQKPETWQGSAPGSASAHLLGISSLTAVAGFFTKKKGFAYLGAATVLPALTITQTNYATRAWRNKSEADGIFTLYGGLLTIIGSLFLPQLVPHLYSFYGLHSIGAALQTLGFNINAKRYRAQVEEIQWLAEQAKVFPKLTAGEILAHFKHNPNEEYKLRKKLGKSRIDYLFKLLEKAETARIQQNISLARFLAPALQSIEFQHKKKKTPLLR